MKFMRQIKTRRRSRKNMILPKKHTAFPFLPILFKILFPVFVVIIMMLCLRGVAGNPDDTTLNTPYYKAAGPFELSPESGRFALTYSMVENHSFNFSIPIARFVTPDLGYWKGRYVSLFAPGVSLLAIPGYIIGKLFDVSQVGSFAIIALFAIGNLFLIKRIAQKLGASPIAATLGGMVFLFATPAFAYGVNLYEHHISTFLILLTSYILLKTKKTWKDYFAIWFLYGISISVDYPNLLLLLPIGIATTFSLLQIENVSQKIKISIKPIFLLGFLGAVVPFCIFAFINIKSYGSPFRLAGSVPYVSQLDASGNPVLPKKSSIKSLAQLSDVGAQSVVNFFQTRNLLNGFYIHLLSPDRGILYFTPVILLGIFGFVIAYRKKLLYINLFLSIIGVNILLYSMWGDPWGGWAFGSRYLIPTYAIMAIFIAIVLTSWRRKWFFILPFWLLFLYAIGVNTLGALTTSTNPPKVQVLSLEALSGHQEKYTYMRNWDSLQKNNTKSFVYQTFLKNDISTTFYFYYISGSIGIVITGLLLALILKKHEK